MFRTIGIRAAHRLGEYMQIGSGIVAHSAEVIALENVQHLNQRHAARAGRRHADDFVAAVSAAHRFTLDRLIPLKIFFGNNAAIRFHVVGESFGILALVESIATVLLNQLERVRQVFLHP